MTMPTPTPTPAPARPGSPTAGAPRIPVADLAALVDEYAVDADRLEFPITDRARWPAVERGALDDDQVSALRFITFIEDHTPGYLAEYRRLYPLDPGLPEDEAIYNREMHRFSTRWAVDEERHADLLFKYQVHAELADADALRRELIREGVKPFHLEERAHHAAIAAYTVIQEKATQIFYRKFQKRVTEPCLTAILAQLARDESRHFAFFCRVLEAYLRTATASSLDAIKEVLFHFKMPLSNSLKGYWRWALRISDAVGYDHTEAYDALLRLVERTADAARDSRTADLRDFVRTVRRVEPAGGAAGAS